MTEFNFGNSRQRSTQDAIFQLRHVPIAPDAIQVSEDLNETRLITTWIVNNASTAPASIFLSTNRGMRGSLEIVPGAMPSFTSWQEGRQLYELQVLIMQIASQQARDLVKVPIIVFDLTQWWLQAGGSSPIDVTVASFPLPYL